MSTQIIEEWLTIPEVAEFFEVSEKQARRITKKLLLISDPDARQEKAEGHFGTPDGQILESYVLLIRSKKCYQLWTEKPNLLELVREFEAKAGKQIKVSTQEEPEVSTHFVPKGDDTVEFLKEIVRKQNEQLDDYGDRVDEFLRRYGEINILLRDMQNKFYLMPPKEEPKPVEEKPKEEIKEEIKPKVE